MRIPFTRLTGLLLSLTTSLAFASGGDIQIHDPWVRAAPPTAKMLAAYMTIENSGDQTRVLKGVSSSRFMKVELHNTVMSEGMARMVRQEAVEISANSSVTFEPGGYHFMLMGKKGPVNIGDKVDFILTFHNGDKTPVEAEVRKVIGAGMEKNTMAH